MPLYRFHDITLLVEPDKLKYCQELSAVLSDLRWTQVAGSGGDATLRLTIRGAGPSPPIMPNSRCLLQAEGFRAFLDDAGFCLTDGASSFWLRRRSYTGDARLASLFQKKPSSLKRNFWAFGLLKMLRSLGAYSVHGAAVVSPAGNGLLLVGPPGSGKSTLALGLVEHGWRYLSDDAVVIRLAAAKEVEALALRKHFFVDAVTKAGHDFPLAAEEVPDTNGKPRRQALVEATFPSRYVARCVPRILVFPRIMPVAQSRLRPLDPARSLHLLLGQSGPQLFDRETMQQHLSVLKTLLAQTSCYALSAGQDLYSGPGRLEALLAGSQESV